MVSIRDTAIIRTIEREKREREKEAEERYTPALKYAFPYKKRMTFRRWTIYPTTGLLFRSTSIALIARKSTEKN